MEPLNAAPGRPQWRIDLRSLFAWMGYAVIAMALGTKPMGVFDSDLSGLDVASYVMGLLFAPLMMAASLALAVALLQQARAISRQAATWSREFPNLRTGARWESALRAGLALLLLACVAANSLCFHGFVVSPTDVIFGYGDVVTEYLWYFAILLGLGEPGSRLAHEPRHRRPFFEAALCSAGLSMLLFVVLESAYATFLTHVACGQVDHAVRPEWRRYPLGTLPNQWWLTYVLVVAVLASFSAAILNVAALSRWGLSGLRRPRVLAATALLLAVSGGYAGWFFTGGRDYFSPDFAGVGLAASWWQQFGGGVLATVLLTAIVYRSWRLGGSRKTMPGAATRSIDVPRAGDSVMVLITLFVAAANYVVQIAVASVASGFAQNFDSIWEAFLSLALAPDVLLVVATLLMSLRLIRLRWRGIEPGPLVVLPLRSRDFVVAWLQLAAVLVVAVGTFAAFAFLFRLGPWYR